MMTKKRDRERILCIDPGTREMGIAVLEDTELIYYGVRTLKKKRPASVLLRETRRIISRLIDDYGIKRLIIEKTFFNRNKNVSNLIVMADEIKALAKKRKLKVTEYAPKTVRKSICQDGKATKREVSKVISARYPELNIYLTQDRKWKVKYWQNCFDAIALGLCYLSE